MPAYNEEEALPEVLREATSALDEVAVRWELIIVDDGSTDRTPALLDEWQEREPRIRVLTQRPNQGYSRALARGFDAARHMVVFYTDSDGQFDLREIATLYPLLKEADMVAGFRVGRHEALSRRLASAGYNRLLALILGVRARDVNCAFKLFRRSFLEVVPLTSEGFLIDAELFARADRGGLRWVQVGILHQPRSGGSSSIRLSMALAAVRDLWRLRRDL